MSKNKNKNIYGTFHTGKPGYKKYSRIFITALLVVIFVLGTGLAITKKLQKPKIQTAVQSTTSEIPGWWYQQYFKSSVCEQNFCQPDADPDQDKLSNAQEFYYHTDPLNSHTIRDKLTDGQLVALGFDPSTAGRVTFNQAVSQDNILGESLVFDQDIKQLINETANINNLKLPVVKDQDIKVIADSTDTINDYIKKSNELIESHFPADRQRYIQEAVASGDFGRIADVQQRILASKHDLKQMSVPASFVQLHKYAIAFLETLSKVVDVPTPDVLENELNNTGNLWYDNTQMLSLLYQKITLETKRLQQANP